MARKMTRNRHQQHQQKHQHQQHGDDARQGFPQQRKKIEIKHLTRTQKEYSKKIVTCDIVFGMGSAGTGKTFLAAQHAMLAKSEGLVDKIVICRPVVNAGGEQLGFLPGGINEKMDPYLRPIFDVFGSYWSKRTILDMIANGDLEVSPLAYMRGRTFTRTFIIADEMQNATPDQLLMLLTRLGDESKMVITGDPLQKDIQASCFDVAKRRLRHVPSIAFVDFNDTDVVRHATVERILRSWNGPVEVSNDTADEEAALGKLPAFVTKEAA